MKRNIINNKIKLFAGIISILFIVSCDDLLNTTSEISLSSSNIFKTPARIEGFVNGIYKSLKGSSLYSGTLLHYNDLRGEEFVSLTENALGGGYVWQNNLSSTTDVVNSVWTQAYQVINSSNILIAGLTESQGVVTDSVKRNYIGEAKFLRAIAYFTLVTTYARPYSENNGNSKGVPLRLQPESTSANNELAPSDVKVIYNQIINDLDTAELFLPKKYSTSLLNTTRVHKNTAIALKTRVYLSKHDYVKVREEAKKIVPQIASPFSATTGVLHKLQDNIATIFSTDYTTVESIFSIPMTATDPPSGSALSNVYNSAPNYALNATSSGIISNTEWKSSDARRGFIRTQTNVNYLKKFAKVSPAIDYIPVIRYAEVLLNYAEAEALAGDINLSIALLKAVRLRSDPTYTFPVNSLTQGEIINTIRVERRIELLGEGFRATDILRDLLTFPDKPSKSSQSSRIVKPTDSGYIYPLPNNEILTNKLLSN
ncbi:MAG: RagB/SusD family nutrient uptake outer membrane protein [Paludibacter sp.]